MELVLVTDRATPITAGQAWVRDLAGAGVQRVRIMQSRTGPRVKIEKAGTPSRPLWIVYGTLDSRGDAVLPGKRYRAGEVGQLAAWLNELAEKGPPDQREKVGPYGLTSSDLGKALDDLERPAPTLEAGIGRDEAVRRVADQLGFPLKIDRPLFDSLKQDTLSEKIDGLSLGTTLAYLLCPLDLGFVPRHPDGGKLEYTVMNRSRKSDSLWPVGHKSQKRSPLLVPQLYKTHRVNIENVPVGRVLEAIARQSRLPLWVDTAGLSQSKIDLNEVNLSVPPSKKLSYRQLLDQASTRGMVLVEIRVDEAGRPFLWVESAKLGR